MFLTYFALLFLLPHFALAEIQYNVDDTNSTNWSFSLPFEPLKSETAVGGSYNWCGAGLSFDIRGVQFDNACRIDFVWSTGKTSYQVPKLPANDVYYDISFAKASGLDPKEATTVTFTVNDCYIGIDYAIVTVEGDASAAPTTSSTVTIMSSGSKPPIGAIVGGVIGGLALILAFFAMGFWIIFRRLRAGQTYQSSPHAAEPMKELEHEHAVSPPSYSLFQILLLGHKSNPVGVSRLTRARPKIPEIEMEEDPGDVETLASFWTVQQDLHVIRADNLVRTGIIFFVEIRVLGNKYFQQSPVTSPDLLGMSIGHCVPNLAESIFQRLRTEVKLEDKTVAMLQQQPTLTDRIRKTYNVDGLALRQESVVRQLAGLKDKLAIPRV
ncbi:hypothetical protein DL96DRAFT_1557337 [Flagelloscypha sp. PMI_526]|nr:hypothetical protein DL96DRAFT_1557337 [Flagelloscypha sp. PMI_526]